MSKRISSSLLWACTVFVFYALLLYPTLAFASDPFSAWSTTTSLPLQFASMSSIVSRNELFLLAGANSAVIPTNISTVANSDGTLQSWQSSSPPPPIFGQASATISNYVYLFGGNVYPPTRSVNSVYLGHINNLGLIDNWQALNNLPKSVYLGSSLIVNNKIYFAGGFGTGNGQQIVSDSVYSASINSDGTIGSWELVGQLPKPLYGFGMVSIGNHLTVFGGNDSNDNASSLSYTAVINSNGTLGNWQSTSQMPGPTFRAAVAVTPGNSPTVVSLGGLAGDYLDKVYYSKLNPDGTLSSWQESQTVLPQHICCSSAAILNNYIYLTGGFSSENGYLDTVYFSKLSLGDVSLSVPLLKQTDTTWKNKIYDSANIWNPKDPTINAWGCALTSATMVFNYNGINKLPTGVSLNPGTLNDWLKLQKDGYVGNGLLNWLALSRLSKQSIQINGISSFDALEFTKRKQGSLDDVKSDLSNKIPDILGEPGHFIVAKGIQAGNMLINDPYFNRSSLSSYSNSFTSINKFAPSHTDLSYVMITYPASVSLQAKDSNGNIVGRAFQEDPLRNPANPAQTNGEPMHIYYIPKPGIDTYSATLSSSLTGKINLGVFLYDKSGDVYQYHKYINLIPNQPKLTQILYDNSQGFYTSPVTYAQLQTDLNNAYIGKNIKADLFTQLKAGGITAQTYQKQSRKTDELGELLSMQNSLDVNKDVKVFDPSYSILLYDLNYLEGNL